MIKEIDIKEIFAERLKDLIKDKGLTIYSFSKEIGIPNATVSDWILKKKTAKIDSLFKVAAFFSVSSDYLIGLVDFEN